jgi:Tfp pilus assembly protein FimT
MVELLLTIVVVGILTGMTIPKINRVMQANQVRRSTALVAADLERAFTIAARYRRPMRLSCTCGTATYTIADLNGGTVRLRRTLRNDTDWGNMTLAFSTTPVDIYPSGVGTAGTTVTITAGTHTRTVVLTSAGQVRIP